MAKTLREIKMDFTAANRLAERLEDLARRYKAIANDQYYSTLRGVGNNWKGENAEAYLRKGERLRTDMTDTARKLSETAGTIRSIAKNTYDAEMRAYRIVLTRDNGG